MDCRKVTEEEIKKLAEKEELKAENQIYEFCTMRWENKNKLRRWIKESNRRRNKKTCGKGRTKSRKSDNEFCTMRWEN